MKLRQAVYLIGAVFLVFVTWQTVEHTVLTGLPTHLYHAVSFAVEIALALVITLIALILVRREARQESRRRLLSDAVITTLAEDLRPPLVSLLGVLSHLEAHAPQSLDEPTRDLLRQAAARGGALLDTVEDLVAMTRGADGPSAHCSALSPSDIAEQAVAAHRADIDAQAIRLDLQMAGDLPGSCSAPDMMLRALSTLIGGAVRATPRGGDVLVRVAREGEEGAVVFSVTDSAPPILDHRTTLEDPAITSARTGLHCCRILADALGGSAWYQPAPAGNTFSLSLPSREPTRG